ncbi:MAG: UvrD-helicase domain-containing protein, partial [Lachnospiraceae bacterium]|nr:UvrD-helicase domain-containing protein [Lachnospiraceae bacterium]
MNSNPAQAEAIRHGEGPMLVLAGPGSGKTYVITRRVRHLIEQLNVRPDNILVITFSRAAASEMRERFLRDSGNQYPGVTFGTFHAVFFHILQNEYNLSPTHILRDSVSHEMLLDILTELQPELAEE